MASLTHDGENPQAPAARLWRAIQSRYVLGGGYALALQELMNSNGPVWAGLGLPPALAMAQIQAGKLHGIAVTSAARSPLAPGLPSLKDLGVNNFDLEIWNAVAAPKSMPKAHVEKLAAAVSEIVRTPEMRQKLSMQGWQAVGSSPEGLQNRIQQDVKALGAIIRDQHITSQ